MNTSDCRRSQISPADTDQATSWPSPLRPGHSGRWSSGEEQTPRVLCWDRNPEQSLLVHPLLQHP